MPKPTRQTNSETAAPPQASFALTRWSVVLAAGRDDSPRGREALEQLCRIYWHPIYSFIRRQGHGPHDAQDLTQEFFARLLAKNYLGSVAPAKGRFRSFLLSSLKHFLANEWDKAGAQKRGAHPAFLPIACQSAESLYAMEPADSLTAEKIFDRRWALTLLDHVLGRLRAEYASEGKEEVFTQLKATLTGERGGVSYVELGGRIGLTEGAVKVAVHRLRQRYRTLVKDEIRHTVSRPEQVEEELQSLFAALAG